MVSPVKGGTSPSCRPLQAPLPQSPHFGCGGRVTDCAPRASAAPGRAAGSGLGQAPCLGRHPAQVDVHGEGDCAPGGRSEPRCAAHWLLLDGAVSGLGRGSVGVPLSAGSAARVTLTSGAGYGLKGASVRPLSIGGGPSGLLSSFLGVASALPLLVSGLGGQRRLSELPRLTSAGVLLFQSGDHSLSAP